MCCGSGSRMGVILQVLSGHPLCTAKLVILSAKELFLRFLQLIWFSGLGRMDERVDNFLVLMNDTE